MSVVNEEASIPLLIHNIATAMEMRRLSTMWDHRFVGKYLWRYKRNGPAVKSVKFKEFLKN